jgi:hypothetical protein
MARASVSVTQYISNPVYLWHSPSIKHAEQGLTLGQIRIIVSIPQGQSGEGYGAKPKNSLIFAPSRK